MNEHRAMKAAEYLQEASREALVEGLVDAEACLAEAVRLLAEFEHTAAILKFLYPDRVAVGSMKGLGRGQAMTKPVRYKVQQDNGVYALKGCDDGDLVDATEYDALAAKLAGAEREIADAHRLLRLAEVSARPELAAAINKFLYRGKATADSAEPGEPA